MRETDMYVAHPETSYDHFCSKCGERVGLYPSTVALISKDRQKYLLQCNRCGVPTSASMVPGAAEDIAESRRRGL